jgi:hypothetical protein
MKLGISFDTVVIPVVAALLGYRLIVWLKESRRTPDPWGPELDEAVEKPESVPLCHHCLAPQEHQGWFCPECGAAVGQFSNYLPNVYIFSIGEGLRAGICERPRLGPLLVIGYLLVGFGYFVPLGPLFVLALVLRRLQKKEAPAEA